MVADTASMRVKRQRVKRKELGWIEVRVWVPTQADKAFLVAYAAEKRKAQEDIIRAERKLERLRKKQNALQEQLAVLNEEEESIVGNRDRPKKEAKKPKKEKLPAK